MTLSFLSQCDTSGYSAPPAAAAWDVAGIWSKIEDQQHQSIINNALDPTNDWFPTDYATNPNSAKNIDSVFDQLSKWIWYKGIEYTLRWGKIETSDGVYDWREPDFILNTVRDLFAITGRAASVNKKVIFLLSYKAFSLAAIDDVLPPHLQQTGTNYPSNGFTRYKYAMGFNAGFTTDVNGYVPRLQDFRDGLTGNDLNGQPIYTLRDTYYDFITAFYNRYKDHPAFGGICTTEPTPSDPASFYDPSELASTNAYFQGRLSLMQKFKQIFTKHLVAEAVDLHNDYTSSPLKTGTQICADNGLAFINPNYYTGLNLAAIYAAADDLSGIVPIIHSCQGLDQDSKTGFFKKANVQPDVYNFLPNPPNYGQPRTAIENPNYNSSGTLISFDPPDMPWVIYRAIYLKANILVYQHNYAVKGQSSKTINGQRVDRYNWPIFAAAMNANTTLLSPNTGGLIQNDPAGGMITDRPLHIAGD